MPKQKTDDLIQLIKSLTRAEKRHFRLFVRRNQASENILFLQLFDFLDKHKEYDEVQILKKIPAIKKRQLSNLKGHLYKQLLTSLRLLNKNYVEEIKLRELVDYARVLYNKGLYGQSLELLDKAKQRALQGNFTALALELVEFEKLIEGQYITQSIEDRARELSEQSMQLCSTLYENNRFSNLALQMYALNLKVGYVRNEKEYYFVKEFFRSKLPDVSLDDLPFWGKVYYCQAYGWYYHMVQDFPMNYRYAQKWIDLFEQSPHMKQANLPLYIKGLHNLLGSLYNAVQYDKFIKVLDLYNDLPNQMDITQDKNVEGLYYTFNYLHNIQKHFMDGTFEDGLVLMPELDAFIESEEYNLDSHRILVFYYLMACMYFGTGDNDNTIHYLNLIINQKNPDYREDIQCFARILNLIAHYELDNIRLVEYQVKSVYRFLSKMEDLHAVQKEIFRFLRKTPRIQRSATRDEFIKLKSQLVKLESDPFERRPFLYLDIISWLESKIENKPVGQIIREKFLANQTRNKDS
jgi:hypothetical protein